MAFRDWMEEHMVAANRGDAILNTTLMLADRLALNEDDVVVFANGTCFVLEEDAPFEGERTVEAVVAYAVKELKETELEETLHLTTMESFQGNYYPVDMENAELKSCISYLDEWEQAQALEELPTSFDRISLLQPQWDWTATQTIMNLVVENSYATDVLQLSASPAAYSNREKDIEEAKPVCIVHGGKKIML